MRASTASSNSTGDSARLANSAVSWRAVRASASLIAGCAVSGGASRGEPPLRRFVVGGEACHHFRGGKNLVDRADALAGTPHVFPGLHAVRAEGHRVLLPHRQLFRIK